MRAAGPGKGAQHGYPAGGPPLLASAKYAGRKNCSNVALPLLRCKIRRIGGVNRLEVCGHEHLRLDDAHNDLRIAAGTLSGVYGPAWPANGYLREVLTEWWAARAD